MFLPVESQGESNFPMATAQIARGTQPAFFPTLSGAQSGSLQGQAGEGVRDKNNTFL